MLHFFKCLGALQYTHAALYHKKTTSNLSAGKQPAHRLPAGAQPGHSLFGCPGGQARAMGKAGVKVSSLDGAPRSSAPPCFGGLAVLRAQAASFIHTQV